jgi:hypothetical protein
MIGFANKCVAETNKVLYGKGKMDLGQQQATPSPTLDKSVEDWIENDGLDDTIDLDSLFPEDPPPRQNC